MGLMLLLICKPTACLNILLISQTYYNVSRPYSCCRPYYSSDTSTAGHGLPVVLQIWHQYCRKWVAGRTAVLTPVLQGTGYRSYCKFDTSTVGNGLPGDCSTNTSTAGNGLTTLLQFLTVADATGRPWKPALAGTCTGQWTVKICSPLPAQGKWTVKICSSVPAQGQRLLISAHHYLHRDNQL